MSQLYFTSDTHFGHTNIASKNTSKWKEGYRHYDSLEEMNQDIVKAINQTVKEEDILYHLGDWSFGGIENIWKFRKQINCKNIHLILGNHDHHIEEGDIVTKKCLPNCYEDDATGLILDGAPDPIQFKMVVYPYELFKSVEHYKEIRVDGTPWILSHYAHRIWHGSHKGWIHLYGHSHDSLPPYGKSMDVGVDSAIRILGSPRPFSVTEIMDIMNKQPLEFPDHHDLKTNTGKPQFAKQRK